MKLLLLLIAAVFSFAQGLSNKADLKELEKRLLSSLQDIVENNAQKDEFARQLARIQEKKEIDNSVEEKCEDQDDQCYTLAMTGACSRDAKMMRQRCPKSCKFCCKDSWPLEACKRTRAFGFCDNADPRARTHCAKTCGECGIRLPAPPPCLESKFGCCWDRTTARLLPLEFGDSKFNGCPECKDLGKEFCTRFARDCSDTKKQKGQQIRSMCPVTCGLCGGSRRQRDFADKKACTMYKLQGLCQSSPKVMAFYCQKTCNIGTGGKKGCHDTDVLDCKLLARHNTCTSKEHKERMLELCPASCGKC